MIIWKIVYKDTYKKDKFIFNRIYLYKIDLVLRNISYNNPKIKKEIESAVGGSFNVLERIKMKGIGSSNL